MTPRRPPYLDPKGRGNKSLVGKREMPEDVYGMVLQRLHDMVRDELPEPQCPAVEPSHSSVARLYTRRHRYVWNQVSSIPRFDRWAMRSERIEGHEWGT